MKVTVVAIFHFILSIDKPSWAREEAKHFLYALYDYLRSRMYYDILIKQ